MTEIETTTQIIQASLLYFGPYKKFLSPLLSADCLGPSLLCARGFDCFNFVQWADGLQ